MSASRTEPGRHDGSKAMCSGMVLKRNRLCGAVRPAPCRRTQSGLSVCHSQIALSLWKSEHPHPARPTMEVTTDPWHATHLTLVVRSTTAGCECARQVSFRKPCAFWNTPHAGTAAAVLTGEFSECLSSTGCCRSARPPRGGYWARADEPA